MAVCWDFLVEKNPICSFFFFCGANFLVETWQLHTNFPEFLIVCFLLCDCDRGCKKNSASPHDVPSADQIQMVKCQMLDMQCNINHSQWTSLLLRPEVLPKLVSEKLDGRDVFRLVPQLLHTAGCISQNLQRLHWTFDKSSQSVVR